MEQLQKKVKPAEAGASGEEEEEALPTPPAIDDVIKAAEMAAAEQREAAAKAAQPKDIPVWSTGSPVLDKTIPGLPFRLGDQDRGGIKSELVTMRGGKKAYVYADLGDNKLRDNRADYVCICREETCRIGPFIRRNGKY